MKLKTVKFRIKTGTKQLWYDAKRAISFIIKVTLAVALGITLANIAAPLLGG